MTISSAQKTLIEDIVNVFETGTPAGKYGEVCTYCDGRNGSRQITYGRSQTTEQGDLKDLLQRYVNAGGAAFAAALRPYLADVGSVSLWQSTEFIELLVRAGADPVMREVQDEFFDTDYLTPALIWATKLGFTLPLSMLVIYDSFIHSGRVPEFLRDRFQEKVPAFGGDEKIWVKEYVYVRGEWLRSYNDPSAPEKSALLRKTIYRTGDLMRAVVAGNWDLTQTPFMANGVAVNIFPPTKNDTPLAVPAGLPARAVTKAPVVGAAGAQEIT